MIETQYLIVGDLHRKWDKLQILIEGVCARDYSGIILVGDIGLENDTDLGNIQKLNIPETVHIYAIMGNHDNPQYWNRDPQDNFHLVQDGEVLRLAEENVLFIGGANSTDTNNYPLKLQSWYDTYVKSLVPKLGKIDVVISHDCPKNVPIVETFNFKQVTPPEGEVNIRDFLQQVYDTLNTKPRRWFFGHYHTSWIWSENSETEFVCKDAVP